MREDLVSEIANFLCNECNKLSHIEMIKCCFDKWPHVTTEELFDAFQLASKRSNADIENKNSGVTAVDMEPRL